MKNTDLEQKRVWDIPIRVFHWALVLTVSAGWIIGENLSFTNVQWHFYLGYTTGGLVLFRLIWGLIGSTPVRLRALVFPWSEIQAYLSKIKSRAPSGSPGHNPLGALSVIALLTVLTVQVVTGLFAASDSLFEGGPLSGFISEQAVNQINAVHEICAKVLLVLVILHVAALVFYLVWKRENLIRPMVTGLKWVRRESAED